MAEKNSVHSFYAQPSVPDRVARKLSPRREELLRGEATPRVVGVLEDGASIVATPSALFVVDDEAVRLRLAWHEVDRASFSGEEVRLSVYPVEDAGTPISLRLDGNVAAVADAVKERVDASIVHVDQTTVSDGTVVRVALRRDGDGQLFSQVTALGAPRLTEADQQRIDDLERRVRQTVGLE